MSRNSRPQPNWTTDNADDADWDETNKLFFLSVSICVIRGHNILFATQCHNPTNDARIPAERSSSGTPGLRLKAARPALTGVAWSAWLGIFH